MPPPLALMHGYTGPHTVTPGGTMVDLVDTYSAYVAPAQAAPSPSAATPDPLLARMGNLEKALRQVQGEDRQSYQFRVFCYFPKAVLPPNFYILEFEKYNGKGYPISHLRAYCGDLAQLQADDRLLIRLFQKSLIGPTLK